MDVCFHLRVYVLPTLPMNFARMMIFGMASMVCEKLIVEYQPREYLDPGTKGVGDPGTPEPPTTDDILLVR